MQLFTVKTKSTDYLLKIALVLSIITICYNIAEGIISVIMGAADETLALFGFGIDSFVEVISGIGIMHMVIRMKNNPVTSRDKFERQALRITGTAFYLLTAGLVAGSVLNIIRGSNPEATLWGIIIASISISTMFILYRYKIDVGIKLDSAPIISDAKCTKSCFYLSFILLGSSLIYELFHIPYVDAVGSLGIAWYALKEGREAFEKAKSSSLNCNDHCD